MSFVNASLLGLGSLLALVPIVLHLAMRPQPKHQTFPALRFLKIRQATNQRQLRLRQWLLLLLRVLVVLLLAFALARPSVSSAQLGHWFVTAVLVGLLLVVLWVLAIAVTQQRGMALISVLVVAALGLGGGIAASGVAIARNRPPLLLGNREAEVAAVILVDTSPRMELIYQNQSRLDRAKQVSQWLVKQLPKDSEVAIVDALPGGYSVDLGAASVAVNALTTRHQNAGFSLLIEESLSLLANSSKARKELYLVTDLTRATWNEVRASNVAELIREQPDVSIQLIDLGVETPVNDAIVDLQLSQESLTPGSPVSVRARIASLGGVGQTTAELYLEPPTSELPVLVDGKLKSPPATVRGRETVAIEDGGEAWINFSLASLPYGTHHGYVELAAQDGLEIDNRRYLTLHVGAPWNVLVVAGDGTSSFMLTELLAPREFRETGRAKFECRTIQFDQLSEQRLADFDAVALLDPAPLDNATWQNFTRYVKDGGGLIVFAGRNVGSAKAFCTEAALEVLPAALERQWRDDAGIRISPRDYEHPITSAFRDFASTVPWEGMPIFRHWVVGPTLGDSQAVISLSNNKPLLLERLVGNGRSLLVTTPVTDPDRPNRAPWNLAISGNPSWPFLVLVDRTFGYLVQSQDSRLNYLVGQSVTLPIHSRPSERFSLLNPEGSWQEVSAAQQRLQIPSAQLPGVYRLRLGPEHTTPRGFSVNLPASVTRLERIDPELLAPVFGSDRLQIATSEDEIVRDIDEARMGREFYPFVLPVLAIVLALEYVTSNRFYQDGAKDTS